MKLVLKSDNLHINDNSIDTLQPFKIQINTPHKDFIVLRNL